VARRRACHPLGRRIASTPLLRQRIAIDRHFIASAPLPRQCVASARLPIATTRQPIARQRPYRRGWQGISVRLGARHPIATTRQFDRHLIASARLVVVPERDVDLNVPRRYVTSPVAHDRVQRRMR